MGRGRGRTGANFGRGPGAYYDWREHPKCGSNILDESLKHTAASPTKKDDTHMTDAEKNAKKRVNFESEQNNSGGVLALTNSMHTDDGAWLTSSWEPQE
jgi:hypothetical protein